MFTGPLFARNLVEIQTMNHIDLQVYAGLESCSTTTYAHCVINHGRLNSIYALNLILTMCVIILCLTVCVHGR